MANERSLLLKLGIRADNVGKLQATFAGITKELQQQGARAQYVGRLKDAMASVTKELQAQQSLTERIAVALQPEVVAVRQRLMSEQAILATRLKAAQTHAAANDSKGIKQQVAAQLALEKAQDKYSAKVQAERNRQTRWSRLFGAAPGAVQNTHTVASATLGAVMGGFIGGGNAGAGIGSVSGSLISGGAAKGGVGGAAMLAGGAALGGIGLAAAGVSAFAGAVSHAVQAANPAIFQMLGDALDDIWATIGQAVMPVFKMWIDNLHFLGDVIASILPSSQDFQEVIDALKPGMDALKKVFTDLAPIIQNVLVKALKVWARVMQELSKWVAAAAGFIEGFFGIEENKAGLKTSRFRAASSVSTLTNTEDIGKKLRESAYGLGSGEDPAKASAGYLQKIDGTTTQIRDIINAYIQAGKNLKKNWEEIKAGGTDAFSGQSDLKTFLSTLFHPGQAWDLFVHG